MKICILTPRFPFPENGGDVLRINNIARYLKKQGHELILISFHESCTDMVSAKKLYNKIYIVKRKKTESALYSLLFLISGKPIQCGYYYSKRFWRLFKRIKATEKPDRYIAHLVRMSTYLVKANVENISTIEMTDALSKTYSLSSKAKGFFLKKYIYYIEKSLMKRFEKYIIEIFPKVVIVSQTDINYLKATINTKQESLYLHTNGVECIPTISPKYDNNKICFIGNMRTLQNQDAVMHFANDIFPIILKHNPNAKFHIVGAEPSEDIINLATNKKNIIVTGFIEDLTAYISDSCIAVAPVQIAAGIQNKVLVAMGTGIPVIMTSLISKAIPELINNENCIIQDDNNTFAEECLSLMGNCILRNKIASRGYEMVKTNYSWNIKLKGY